MLFRKRIWFQDFHLKEYCTEITQLKISLQELLDCGILEKPKGLFDDLVQMRIFLESLTAIELNLLSTEIQKKLKKYAPIENDSFPSFNGSDMNSPLVVLKPFEDISEAGKEVIGELIKEFMNFSESKAKSTSKYSKGRSLKIIIERLEAYFAHKNGNSNALKKSSTLHRFFISK